MSSETAEQPAFSEWCIIELMGHRRLAGLVTEQQIAGHGFLRLDVPAPIVNPEGVRTEQPVWSATQFYSPTSVYCLTPVTEEVARKVAADNRPQPATRWELTRGDEEPF